MKHALILLLLLPVAALRPQDARLKTATERQHKFLVIAALQDARDGHNPALVQLLSDADAAVRARAALACGSLQDTTLLDRLLTLTCDPDPQASENAAFAVGQTGTMLSTPGQKSLQARCVKLCESGTCTSRLAEEIGKFGNKEALDPLTRHPGTLSDLAIARFAIRKISTSTATQILLDRAANDSTGSWENAYALQRVGADPLIQQNIRLIINLARSPNPLVRMNAAALLGKLRDSLGAGNALGTLAASDPDWRVRVNALRALGSRAYSGLPALFDRFREAFRDKNEHVALTALATIGDFGSSEVTVPRPVLNDLWAIATDSTRPGSMRRKAEAAGAIAKIAGSSAFTRMARITPGNAWLESKLTTAIGMTGNPESLPALMNRSMSKDPMIVCASLDGLDALGKKNPADRKLHDSIAAVALRSLAVHDVAVITTAAALAGDSLYRRPATVYGLLTALSGLNPPDDTEAMQQIVQTLGSLGDTSASQTLRGLLRSSHRSVASAAASALHQLTGKSYSAEAGAPTLLPPPDTASIARLPDTVNVRLSTSQGKIDIELYPSYAPFTVLSFLRLASRRFFDGLVFHRVVPNFVIQGGDPRGDGWGGPGYAIRSEFSPLRYERGTLGIASAGKDTEGSQFFITHSPQPHLDGRYTIFGRVVEGMDVVDRIQVGDTIIGVEVQHSF